MAHIRVVVTTLMIALVVAACGNGDGASTVAFSEPTDGATVSSPVQVVMTAENIAIVPAGEPVEGEGHFHLMINVDCVTPGEVIPSDDQHLHFGDASTETTLDLPPGEHRLCLQLGDGVHTALDATDEITVTVE
jgi:hypothetical protein